MVSRFIAVSKEFILASNEAAVPTNAKESEGIRIVEIYR